MGLPNEADDAAPKLYQQNQRVSRAQFATETIADARLATSCLQNPRSSRPDIVRAASRSYRDAFSLRADCRGSYRERASLTATTDFGARTGLEPLP